MKRCQVTCLRSEVVLYLEVCGEPATYYQSGCPGAVGGSVFVCDRHRGIYQFRKEQSLEDYYVEHGERILGDNNPE